MIFFKMTQTYSRLFATLLFSMLLVACGGGGSGSTALPATYDITGLVTSGLKSVEGVTITMSGLNKTALTNANGSYTITGVTNGTYTFTPTKTGETFTPQNLTTATSAGTAAPTFGIN